MLKRHHTTTEFAFSSLKVVYEWTSPVTPSLSIDTTAVLLDSPVEVWAPFLGGIYPDAVLLLINSFIGAIRSLNFSL